MELICTHCNKDLACGSVAISIVLYKGKLYHKACYDSVLINEGGSDLCNLCKRFPEIDTDILRSLFETHGFKCINKHLSHNWCLITEGLHEDVVDDIGINYFGTKKEMLDWLSNMIHDNISEDCGWSVRYILKKGKVVTYDNEFHVNVSL